MLLQLKLSLQMLNAIVKQNFATSFHKFICLPRFILVFKYSPKQPNWSPRVYGHVSRKYNKVVLTLCGEWVLVTLMLRNKYLIYHQQAIYPDTLSRDPQTFYQNLGLSDFNQ